MDHSIAHKWPAGTPAFPHSWNALSSTGSALFCFRLNGGRGGVLSLLSEHRLSASRTASGEDLEILCYCLISSGQRIGSGMKPFGGLGTLRSCRGPALGICGQTQASDRGMRQDHVWPAVIWSVTCLLFPWNGCYTLPTPFLNSTPPHSLISSLSN